MALRSGLPRPESRMSVPFRWFPVARYRDYTGLKCGVMKEASNCRTTDKSADLPPRSSLISCRIHMPL